MNPMHNPHFYHMGPNPGFAHNQHQHQHQISQMTNSPDPRLKAARVFIGNLNSQQVTKEQLSAIFCKHGEISGISLMNGFGFVQFMNEFSARKAVQREYGRVIAHQPMDLRLANDPNPSRIKGFKRVNQTLAWQPFVDPNILPVTQTTNRENPMVNKKIKFQSMTSAGQDKISGDEPSSWLCAFCKQQSPSPWELMKHASLAHQTQIYIANPEYENK